MDAGIVFNSRSAPQSPILGPLPSSPVIDLSRFNPEEYPMEVRLYVVIILKCNYIQELILLRSSKGLR